jgi:hypothetical protein
VNTVEMTVTTSTVGTTDELASKTVATYETVVVTYEPTELS